MHMYDASTAVDGSLPPPALSGPSLASVIKYKLTALVWALLARTSAYGRQTSLVKGPVRPLLSCYGSLGCSEGRNACRTGYGAVVWIR
jgi:hypothetical protein